MTSKVTDKIKQDRKDRDDELKDSVHFGGNVILGVIVLIGAALALFGCGMHPLSAVTFDRNAATVVTLTCLVICFVPLLKSVRARQYGYTLQVMAFAVLMGFGTWFWINVSIGLAAGYWNWASSNVLFGLLAKALPLFLVVCAASRVAKQQGWIGTATLGFFAILSLAAWSGWAFSF